MSEYVMTLGQIHAHRVNGHTIDKDCAVVIKAKNYDEARQIMFDITDGKFATSYTKEEFEAEDSLKYFPRGYIEIN